MPAETAPNGEALPIVRRLSTILCADVAGYSQMMGVNEERTVRVFRGHREIFESLVKLHRGRIFNTAGDALLVEFNSAVEAVRCATEIQAALSTRNEQLAPEERILFRMGINLGDVIVQGDDLLGDGVNVAARIQAATEPGGICISGSVYDQIQNKLSLEFKLLGEQVYKNIARPVRTYTINEGAAVTARARRSSKVPAAIAAAALAIAGASYWGYQQYDTQRTERLRVESQMAAQLAAQKQATEQAQRAAEDAKRDAQLQAQKQAADETLRRAQEERNRLEQDRKLLETEKRAAETAKKQAETSARAAPAAPVAPVAPVAPKTTAQFDGTYNGQFCNNFANAKPACWTVALYVRNGVIEGNWPGPMQKPSKASGTIAPDGAVEMNLAGWTLQGSEPADARLVGRIAGDALSASGQWRGGLRINGSWKHASVSAAAPAATPARNATQYDGTYAGRLCNNPKDDARRSCWQADLTVRNGVAEANWLSRTKNTSGARGSVGADGALALKLNGWTRDGNAVEGRMAGNVAGDAIAASGRWADGGSIAGDWKRVR